MGMKVNKKVIKRSIISGVLHWTSVSNRGGQTTRKVIAQNLSFHEFTSFLMLSVCGKKAISIVWLVGCLLG